MTTLATRPPAILTGGAVHEPDREATSSGHTIITTLDFDPCGATVRIRGALTIAAAGVAEQVIRGHRGQGRRDITVDLSAVSRTDTRALALLQRISPVCTLADQPTMAIPDPSRPGAPRRGATLAKARARTTLVRADSRS